MEEDEEIESAGLLEKFGCMQTLDKDDLISQMQRLIGNEKLNASQAVFYLEMNLWNVQAAVCSYFDLLETQSTKLPSMTFVKDVTIGEGESVPPSTAFVKTWKVQNTGSEVWPPGCKLKFTQGTPLGAHVEVALPLQTLLPWQVTEISLEMKSPAETGIYESKWRMSTPSGTFFGDPIFVIITVEPGGTLALTQQMSKFNELGGPSPPPPPPQQQQPQQGSPFASSPLASASSHYDRTNTNANPFALFRPLQLQQQQQQQEQQQQQQPQPQPQRQQEEEEGGDQDMN